MKKFSKNHQFSEKTFCSILFCKLQYFVLCFCCYSSRDLVELRDSHKNDGKNDEIHEVQQKLEKANKLLKKFKDNTDHNFQNIPERKCAGLLQCNACLFLMCFAMWYNQACAISLNGESGA